MEVNLLVVYTLPRLKKVFEGVDKEIVVNLNLGFNLKEEKIQQRLYSRVNLIVWPVVGAIKSALRH